VLLAAACAQAAAGETLTFVMQAFPPFAVEDHGEVRGVFPEFLKHVCDALKATCRIEVYPWRRALRLAEAGVVDGILVIQNLPGRERAFHISEPIVHSSYSVFVSDRGGARLVGEVHRVDYAIGLSKKRCDTARAARFNAAVREQIRNGTLQAIVARAGVEQADPAMAETVH
jgi:ABC-type amino acid transport substrate-binding protein